jgi:sigma-54-specific transcriptional regulator
LENVIHHALLVSRGESVRPDDLNLGTLRHRPVESPGKAIVPSGEALLKEALHVLFEENHPDLFEIIQDNLIRTAYDYCHRNQVQTAKLLGISRNIVRARLAQCGELHIPERKKEHRAK